MLLPPDWGLRAPQAGTLDTLIDRLPGWPDNINRSADGNFWLALVLPDVPLVTPLPLLPGLLHVPPLTCSMRMGMAQGVA